MTALKKWERENLTEWEEKKTEIIWQFHYSFSEMADLMEDLQTG